MGDSFSTGAGRCGICSEILLSSGCVFNCCSKLVLALSVIGSLLSLFGGGPATPDIAFSKLVNPEWLVSALHSVRSAA